MRLYSGGKNREFMHEMVGFLMEESGEERAETQYILNINRDKEIYQLWKTMVREKNKYIYNKNIKDAVNIIVSARSWYTKRFIYFRVDPRVFGFSVGYKSGTDISYLPIKSFTFSSFGLQDIPSQEDVEALSKAFTYNLWLTLARMYPDIYIETDEYDTGRYDFLIANRVPEARDIKKIRESRGW